MKQLSIKLWLVQMFLMIFTYVYNFLIVTSSPTHKPLDYLAFYIVPITEIDVYFLLLWRSKLIKKRNWTLIHFGYK